MNGGNPRDAVCPVHLGNHLNAEQAAHVLNCGKCMAILRRRVPKAPRKPTAKQQRKIVRRIRQSQ